MESCGEAMRWSRANSEDMFVEMAKSSSPVVSLLFDDDDGLETVGSVCACILLFCTVLFWFTWRHTMERLVRMKEEEGKERED